MPACADQSGKSASAGDRWRLLIAAMTHLHNIQTGTGDKADNLRACQQSISRDRGTKFTDFWCPVPPPIGADKQHGASRFKHPHCLFNKGIRPVKADKAMMYQQMPDRVMNPMTQLSKVNIFVISTAINHSR